MRSDVLADGMSDGYETTAPRLRLLGFAGARFVLSCVAAVRLAAPPAAEGEAWWSQTGSNRRPHACKARALPAELWPRTRRRNALSRIVALASAGATAQQPSFKTGLPSRSCQSSEGWWAWEDLNFRPHAYQARALTN